VTDTDLAVLRVALTRDEALRLHVYDDATGQPLARGDTLQGVLTIGYGRAIGITGISQAEADAMLDADITTHVRDLERAFPVVRTLDATRQIVLAQMCFNLGVTKLARFALLWRAITAGDFARAGLEMIESHWAEQIGPRATRLAAQMVSGEPGPVEL